MEDVELSRRLKRTGGWPLCLRQRVVTSGRRWERHGPWKTILAMWRLRLAYWRGADPAGLADVYAAAAASAPSVVLQIFARNPMPGEVKSRLARSVGAAEAARVYARFVDMTLSTGAAARAAGIVDRVELWCSPDADAPAFAAWRARHGVELKVQAGADLGARMQLALDSAVGHGARAILVGTDCPVLDVSYLALAVAALDDHDAVFGPVEDGGYVLVGVARSVDVFTGIPWSTADTMAATRAAMAAQGLRWHELPTLWDVDLPSDLARWQALAAPAPGLPASRGA
jgi:rSAM/selenodomain-associated transferase 1